MPNIPIKHRVLLGFDFGMKRIGLAVGQTVTGTAVPLTTLKAIAGVPNTSELNTIIKQWQPDGFVVGIPLNADGTTQAITQIAKNFAESLRQQFNLPVYVEDERYTTLAAKQTLFEQGGFKRLQNSQVDSWAAKLILEAWLKKYVSENQ